MSKSWSIGDKIEYESFALSQERFDQELFFGWDVLGPIVFKAGKRPSFEEFASTTVHTNPDLARRQGLRGTVAPGVMFIALIIDMLLGEFGLAWAEHGRLSVRFIAPAGPGDILHTSATVKELVQAPEGTQLVLDILIVNNHGARIVEGEARAQAV
jgi:hypothetical protein